jgi:hypothetical protein
MPTDTPPPYFPQSSLSPPDSRRYLKFKLLLFAMLTLFLLALSGVVLGVLYLLGII